MSAPPHDSSAAGAGDQPAPGYVTPLQDARGQDVGFVLHTSPDYMHSRMALSKREKWFLLAGALALFAFMLWLYAEHEMMLAVIAVPLAALIIIWLLVFDYNRRAADARVTVTADDIFVHWVSTDVLRIQRDKGEKLIVTRRGGKWLLRDHRPNHGRLGDYRMKIPVAAFPNLCEFLRNRAADSCELHDDSE